jgi:general secretion pathway protein G
MSKSYLGILAERTQKAEVGIASKTVDTAFLNEFGTADQPRRRPRSGRELSGGASGFTLLELVIVMTIMVVLVAIGVVNYQKIQAKTKETLLKQDLKTMRELIDKYAADKENLPQSLDDLVTERYMREIPVDPITNQADWATELGDDLLARDEGRQGIVDVHSKAGGIGTDGKAYSDY